ETELEHEVGARELEEDGVTEGRSFPEQPAGHRDGSVRAARACGAEHSREADPAKIVCAEGSDHGFSGDERLDNCGDQEAEGEGPQDLPEHEKSHLKGFPDCIDDANHWRIYTRYVREGRDR